MSDYEPDTVEERHSWSASKDNIRLKTSIKRGTETRDQDSIRIEIRGNDPKETVKKLNKVVANVRTTADELRKIQPGDDNE